MRRFQEGDRIELTKPVTYLCSIMGFVTIPKGSVGTVMATRFLPYCLVYFDYYSGPYKMGRFVDVRVRNRCMTHWFKKNEDYLYVLREDEPWQKDLK